MSTSLNPNPRSPTDLGVDKGVFNSPVLSYTAVLDAVDRRRFRNSFDK